MRRLSASRPWQVLDRSLVPRGGASTRVARRHPHDVGVGRSPVRWAFASGASFAAARFWSRFFSVQPWTCASVRAQEVALRENHEGPRSQCSPTCLRVPAGSRRGRGRGSWGAGGAGGEHHPQRMLERHCDRRDLRVGSDGVGEGLPAAGGVAGGRGVEPVGDDDAGQGGQRVFDRGDRVEAGVDAAGEAVAVGGDEHFGFELGETVDHRGGGKVLPDRGPDRTEAGGAGTRSPPRGCWAGSRRPRPRRGPRPRQGTASAPTRWRSSVRVSSVVAPVSSTPRTATVSASPASSTAWAKLIRAPGNHCVCGMVSSARTGRSR